MATPEIELLVDAAACVGEGPIWDERMGVLWWVDILGRTVHRTDPATADDQVIPVEQEVGAVALCENGQLLLALRDGIAVLDPTNGTTAMIAPADGSPGSRMNDGRVGPDGGFWVGRMPFDPRPGQGSLLRFGKDRKLRVVLDGLYLPNGLDWSPDGERMYFIDTMAGSIDVLEIDPGCTRVSSRRPLIRIERGIADGMTVDAAGSIWVGLWGGWGIERYAPDGSFEARIEMPCANVTSCAFGGPRLDELYVTTAWEGLSEAERAAQPSAGGLFRLRPGVPGLPARRYSW